MQFQMFDIVNFSIIPNTGDFSDIHAEGMITGIHLVPDGDRPRGYYSVSIFDKPGISYTLYFLDNDVTSDDYVSVTAEFIRHGSIEEFTEIFSTGG